MKRSIFVLSLWMVLCASFNAAAQVTNWLPGRTLIKLVPDYLRPRIYALNQSTENAGTLLALNATNGSTISEIPVGIKPTDMVITPGCDALYIMNTGSRTISKVDLNTFTVVAEKSISTPNAYDLSNPLYLALGQSNLVYFTDGAWAPSITTFDFAAGTNVAVYNDGEGAGGLTTTRDGKTLYRWRQFGWGAGNVNSWVTRYDTVTNNLTPLENSFVSWRRDPLDTPLFLDIAETRVFNKQQMFSATNVAVLLTQFSENIYAISLDGSLAFGLTGVFNAQNGATLTNLSFSTTVQTLSGDQKKLFRYRVSTSDLFVYDMSSITPVNGPAIAPTPADGAVVGQPPTNLLWSVSPYALAYDVYYGTNSNQVAAANFSSTQYLGRVAAPTQSLPQTPSPEVTYYWRVDVVGFNTTNKGPIWSFMVSSLAVSPSQISLDGIAGFNPATATLSLTSAVPLTWTAAVTGSNWLTINPTNGTSPGTVMMTFHTTTLPAGLYTNTVEVTANNLKVKVPVTLDIKTLNLIKMATDGQRPYIYALQAPAASGQNGQLLFFNTTTESIDKVLPIGINPTDLTVNDNEGRLYVASWTENATYVVDLASQTLLPPLHLGTDVYKINAGLAGRLVIEGEDQWVDASLVNSSNGTIITSIMVREGDGEFDPSGRYYYHVDNNSSGATITKYDVGNNRFVALGSAGPHYYYGSRNLVMSLDGSRLFWTSAAYDANLTDLGVLGAEIYSCSTNGSVAFSNNQAFETATRRVIYNLPISSSVSVVDYLDQRYWYFDSSTHQIKDLALSVIRSPSITRQPDAYTSASEGDNVYLSVTAMGLSPFFYQWSRMGTNLAGATDYFLSMNNIQPSQAGDYQVIISNAFGAVTSAIAHVEVLVPPTITSQPQGANVLAGRSVTLSVTAMGSTPLTYQWTFENVNLADATNSIFTISNVQASHGGYYRVIAQNAAGSATSEVALIRVLPASPIIVSNPVSATIVASEDATFRVVAIGSQPLFYQWTFNGTFIPGANTSQYSLTNAQADDAGHYCVIVTNSVGSVTSAVATLTVTPAAPYFVTQPAGLSSFVGDTFTLRALAVGSEPIGYQWRHNGMDLPGAHQTSLIITNAQRIDSGDYTLVAYNTVGVSTSAVAQVTVNQPPILEKALTNQVVDLGDTVLLEVAVSGSGTLTYSWRFNNTPLEETGATLTITNIQKTQSGYYQVTVASEFGSLSSTGRISVFNPPSWVIAWGDNSGGQAEVPTNLAVAVSGGDFHSLALRHNGSLMAWGYNDDGQASPPTNALRFVSIASGKAHNLAITESGSVIAWGFNDSGQCDVPPQATSVLEIAAGDSHSMALLSSGNILCWGNNTYGQVSGAGNLTDIRAIAAGRIHSLALRNNGTVRGWGDNSYNQATPPPTLSGVTAIAAGYRHSVALLSNGRVVVWGDNMYGQTNMPPDLSNVVAIAAGDFHTLALRENGSVIAWGNNTYGQTEVPAAVRKTIEIASGYYHGLALVTPSLRGHISSGMMVLEWSGPGALQWAPTIFGPFTEISDFVHCYTNSDMSPPTRFFRLRLTR